MGKNRATKVITINLVQPSGIANYNLLLKLKKILKTYFQLIQIDDSPGRLNKVHSNYLGCPIISH